jgi:predicted TPR repeat methyltransferase
MTQTMTKEMSMPDALRMAVDMQQNMRIAEAALIYRAILNAAPDHPDALLYLGVLSHMAGERDAGEALVRRALAVDPTFVSAHVNLGNVLRQQRRNSEAESAYLRALELAPDNVDALCNLGSIHNERREFEQAIGLFEQAIAVRPEHAEALHNMGNSLRALDRVNEAVAAYERAGALGGSLSADQRRAGYAMLGVGALDRAIEFFERAIALGDNVVDALRGLARAHTLADHHEAAMETYKTWLQHAPGDPVATHMLDALLADTLTTRASDAYVRKTFDDFSDSFDQVLESLDYRAPRLVGEAVATAFGAPSRTLDVLDAGCGTGLVGVEVRPYARWLVGVDLSKGMLEKARGRELYDVIDEGELVSYIQRSVEGWDLITCADTLCYFGDISGFAEAAVAALRPGGRIVFTVENEEDVERYRIEPHGRFSHARGYVEHTLAAAGFDDLKLEKVVLRLERLVPVNGLLVTAARPVNA